MPKGTGLPLLRTAFNTDGQQVFAFSYQQNLGWWNQPATGQTSCQTALRISGKSRKAISPPQFS